jgi:hypothetical protein
MARIKARRSTSTTSESRRATARGDRTSPATTPTRTTGRPVTSARPSRSRIAPRSGGSRVVPRRVSRSNAGWTTVGAQRTFHWSPDLRTSSSVS